MSTDSLAVVEVDQGVATVSMNRTERLNAWGPGLAAALVGALQEVENDDSIKTVILTGKGRAFSAGADMKEAETHHIESIEDYLKDYRGRPIFDILSEYSKPIMAAINGYAIGIGALMPLCCDFVYAAESAKFQLPQTALGILPAYGGPLRVVRAIGKLNAMEMILTGRMVKADEAKTMGMVQRVVPDAELLSVCQATMHAITEMPPVAVAFTRESLRVSVDANHMRSAELSDALRYMILAQLKDTAKRHEAWRKKE